MAKMLIQRSAEFNIDLNARDNIGKTSFHWACESGNLMMVEILIQALLDH